MLALPVSWVYRMIMGRQRKTAWLRSIGLMPYSWQGLYKRDATHLSYSS